MSQGKKGQLLGGLVLLTLGVIFVLDRLYILEVFTSWPLILVVIGVGFFLINRHTLAGWIVGGIGVIFLSSTSSSLSSPVSKPGVTSSVRPF